MQNKEGVTDLNTLGVTFPKTIHQDLPTPLLYEKIVKRGEGQICHLGPVVVRTGDSTELPLVDKFVVKKRAQKDRERLRGEVRFLSEEQFRCFARRLRAYLQNKEVFVQHGYVGRDPQWRIPVRFVTETAWHSLFVRNLFESIPERNSPVAFDADFSLVHVPGFHAVPEKDGTRSSAALIIHPEEKTVVICGNAYAGEIRNTVFTLVHMLLPSESAFSMRCSVNVGPDGDVAVFMGRGGTGKTTLSVDPKRKLVGDHLHGWSENGLFNYERGAYARVLGLSMKEEPDIHACTRRFGTVLENVCIDPHTRQIDLEDRCLTENARAAFPLPHISRVIEGGGCGHPQNIFLLTCDALGVLPPLARLTPEMAVYAFLTGYTSIQSRVGSGRSEPYIMFNTCFGASAMTLPSQVCGQILMDKIRKHNVACWLVNTGWVGEPQGRGDRMRISHSRALVRAAASGKLTDADYIVDPVFQFEIPKACPGVPARILSPRKVAADEGEYEVRANRLARGFAKDFSRFEGLMPEKMRTMLSGVLSLDDKFDLLEEFNLSV